MPNEHTTLALLDAASSVGLLVSMIVLFVRGDIVPRKTVEDIVANTVAKVLDELAERRRDRNN